MPQRFGKTIIIFGLVYAAAGAFPIFADKIPPGGMPPGGIDIKKDGLQNYIPVTSAILIGLILSGTLRVASIITKK